jgi:hypothetical protein
MQNNFAGLLQFEINKVKHELDNQVEFARSKLQNQISTGLSTLKEASQTGMQVLIDETSLESLTGLTSYTNVRLSNYSNYIDATLATKANKTTLDALDEFTNVMQSAFDISYTGLTDAQKIALAEVSPDTFVGDKELYYSYELGYFLVKVD